MTPPSPAPAAAHSWVDDGQAFVCATLVIALGLHLLASAGLMVGGVPGLAFLLRYATGWPLGLCLFLANLPFYLLAWRALGTAFTLKTLLAMSLLAAVVELMRHGLVVASIHPALGAVAGGVLAGIGILMLLRHRASLGGIGVLALQLQRTLGWNLAAVQLALDTAILCAGLVVVPFERLGWSVLAAVAMNLILFWNHRPGRYLPAEGWAAESRAPVRR
jgi:uncharacterized membrane-anchored protein YitT (DUF2179 family)